MKPTRYAAQTSTSTIEASTALEHLRTFVTVLVVAHHAFIAYNVHASFDKVNFLDGAPIVDPFRWLGFDVIVLFNDTFFMSLMFLLSGLFVWPSLVRKGNGKFLLDRTRRLGLPFLLAVSCLMPLAYYPSFLMTGNDIGLFAFYKQTLLEGPWPGGPAWFIWILLAFNVLVVAARAVAGAALGTAATYLAEVLERPAMFLVALVVVSVIAYVPMLEHFGPSRWFAWGPMSVQASRVLLYLSYFVLGVCIGARGIDRGLLSRARGLAARWGPLAILCLVLFSAMVAVNIAKLDGAIRWTLSQWTLRYGLLWAISCATIGSAMLALFLRFASSPSAWTARFSEHAYGIYLVHYAPVIWLQYWLLDAPIPAIAKGLLVFALSLALSWIAVAKTKRITRRWRRSPAPSISAPP